MKRWLIPAALLAVVILGEGLFRGTDVAKMEPVEAVRLTLYPEGVVLQTDTGSSGVGKNLLEAVEDMRQTAEGVIFLETAEYLLLENGKTEIIPELMGVFRPSCKILFLRGPAEPKEMASFLRSRRVNVTLLDWKNGEKIPPTLWTERGRFYLAE